MLRNLNQVSSSQRILGTPKSGVLAPLIPSSGDNGPGYAYSALEFPEDNETEIRGAIVVWPSAGVLTALEDTEFEFTGAPDGTYTFQWQMYANGVLTGSPNTVTLQVGVLNHATSGTVTAQVAAASGAAARFRLHAVTGVLEAGVVEVTGDATRFRVHATTSAASAEPAVLAGEAFRMRQHVTTSALEASGASATGTALRAREHFATGNPTASPGEAAAEASRTLLHASSGLLSAGSAALSGAAVHGTHAEHVTTGDILAALAVVAGAGARNVGAVKSLSVSDYKTSSVVLATSSAGLTLEDSAMYSLTLGDS